MGTQTSNLYLIRAHRVWTKILANRRIRLILHLEISHDKREDITMNVDVVRQKLLDSDTNTVLKELVDLYRRADILHTPQLGRILEALFPVWGGLLHSQLPSQLCGSTQTVAAT